LTEQELNDLVAEWQDRLGLQNWDIRVVWGDEAAEFWSDVADKEDKHACCWRAKSYDRAKIYFNPEHEKWEQREAAVNVVHELLHCVLRDIEFVIDQFDGLLLRDVDRVITDTFQHHVEGAVERLANRFVDLMAVEDAPY
jgi:hypothetical protein